MTATALTLDTLKEWSKDCAPAALAVLMARVYAQMERERVNAYILPIFNTYKFECADRWKDRGYEPPITSPDRIYLCDDEPQVQSFYEACDKAHRDHGFTGKPGHCPALIAEHLVIVTEQALIDLAIPLTGIDHVYGENRTKYLDLLIGSCLKAEKETK